MTIVGNVAILDPSLKARGDPGAGRSVALDFDSPYILRHPYLNIQQIAGGLSDRAYLSATPWRNVLYSSPTVWAVVKALNDQLVALPWRITAKDKSQRHTLRGKIDYYTQEVVGQFNNENYDTAIVRVNRDVLSIPQGGNCEVIHKTSGQWAGEVDRVEFIDGGTLAPTHNYHYPTIQRDPRNSERYVVFARDELRRVQINPRSEYNLTWYQQAPLEMCYLAIDAISKGDFYYLNLLTDIPTAGILDLKDFTKEETVNWAKSWKELLTGSDALKIPILYEHVEPAQWIPFGPPPEGMMLNDSLDRYTKLIHACFGIYTQDTGLTERDIVTRGQGSATLERRAWHKFNALVAQWETFWNSILPRDLEFKYEIVNLDESERLARALVARANAWGILARGGILGIKEIRRELSESGFMNTYINAEEIPEDVIAPGMMGGGINPVITGQSRWPEQRLPAEGRRQSLPAPRSPQREEWYQRVRPKSQADSLTTILADAFQGIAENISDEDLRQLVHDAGIVYIPVVQEAKSFSDSYDRWLEEYYLLSIDRESLLKSQALIRKQRRVKDTVKDLLKAYNWWDIHSDELMAAVITVFKSTYEDALDDFASEVWQALYEENLVESPYPEDYQPSLVNAVILSEIDHYANRMAQNLNQGSQYFIYHALTRAVMKNLSKPEIRERINEGEDPAEIIAALGLIEDIAAAFRAELAELIVPRAERAAAFEISNIIGSARLNAMSRMGLTLKRWLNLGPEPCEMCVKNAAAGDVALDYEYESAFGSCLWPLAHPFGNCVISFVKSQLLDKIRVIVDTGGEITLYRGD